MDLQGILGIDADVRNGFSGINVRHKIDADATKDEIEALVAQSQKRSAVFDVGFDPARQYDRTHARRVPALHRP